MPHIAALLFALVLASFAGSAEARESLDTCYAYLTMRQVQTHDYSYEVRQNCQIVPRTYAGPAYGSEATVPVYAPNLVYVRPGYAPRRVRVGPRRIVRTRAARPAHRRAKSAR